MVNAEQYAKAKELFFELMVQPPLVQATRLTEVEVTEPDIAQEVRLLLEKNSSRTIMESTQRFGGESITSKSRVSSQLNRLRYWLVGGFTPLSIALISLVIICTLGLYLRYEINRGARGKYLDGLKSAASEKRNQILTWVEYNQLRFSDWGKQSTVQKCIAELDQMCRTNSPDTLNDDLRNAPQQRLIATTLTRLASRNSRIGRRDNSSVHKASQSANLRYAVWNANFQLLADWQFESDMPIGFGQAASMTGKSILSRVFEDGAPQVLLPKPSNETMSKNYPLEADKPFVMFFVPIFGASRESLIDQSEEEADTVIAAMMIRSSGFLDELQAILDVALVPDAQCYMIDTNGHFTSEVADQEFLLSLPEMQDQKSRSGKVFFPCLDPGADLLQPKRAKLESPENWPPTLAARGLMLQKDGENIQGYRDYRGIQVIGAWRWIDALERGVIVEVRYADAFRGIEFVNSVFFVLLALPMTCMALLLSISLVRHLRNIDFSNRSLGPYRLSEKLGEGGLGVVYLGVHKALHRPAAIKLIKPNVVNQATIKRFEREVRLAASFDNPHVVHIYDFGISKDGHVFCVMQLVEGITLAQLMEFEGSIPIARTLSFLKQVAQTLAEAHQFGLVHRDIKPQNVMINSTSPKDYVKVVDFGLAKHIADPIRRDMSATRIVIGTPGFIAPERIESPWITDPRIDTFSFGVLGLFLLTGKVPGVSATPQSIREATLSKSPDLGMDMDTVDELISLLFACSSPDPEKRPATMLAVSATIALLSKSKPWPQRDADHWWATKDTEVSEWIKKYRSKLESRSPD
ncbi:serine/threonine-protein kinase [Pirellulaceae bacterium SH449]